MNFQVKQLEKPERICVRLRSLREQKKISLPDIADRLKMSKGHILALEEGRPDELPFAPVYKKKLVRQYCEIVGGDYTELVHQFVEEELKDHLDIGSTPMPKTKQFRLWQNLPFLFRLGSVLCVSLLFFAYLGIQVKKIIDPPELNLFSPLDGYITSDPNLHLRGETDKEVKITVNGKEIKNTESGAFDEVLTLSPGVNTLVITAQKKHGKTTNETRYVVLQGNNAFTLSETENKNN